MPAADAAAPYRRLFAEPVLRGLAVADACARLPQGMLGITLLLAVAEHAAMTTAGLAVAAYTLGQAVTGPLRGRVADRYGLGPVCAVLLAGYAVALLGLLACALARGPAAVLVGTAAAAGLIVPPLSPGMRSLWSVRAAASLRQAAFALDAAIVDLAYITGPVLASSLATVTAPAVALGVMLALTAAAIVLVGLRSGRPAGPSADRAADRTADRAADRAGRRAPSGRPFAGPLRSAALRRLLVTGALVNTALSATEVALTAYVRHHHALWASGPLLAGVSAGSIAGSLLIGTRQSAGGTNRRLPRLLACYACGLAGLTAASLFAPLLAVAAPLAGLCLGPSLATLFGQASVAAPGGGTEAQGWLNSMMNGGAAAGAALAGLTSGRPVLALAVAAATAAAAAGWASLPAARTGPVSPADPPGPVGARASSAAERRGRRGSVPSSPGCRERCG